MSPGDLRELVLSLREPARRLEMSFPGVGVSVERGETISAKMGCNLLRFCYFFKSVLIHSHSVPIPLRALAL